MQFRMPNPGGPLTLYNACTCPPTSHRKQHPGANLVMGGAAGTIAATVCYPLDTIRRRMQMKGTMYSGQVGVEQAAGGRQHTVGVSRSRDG